MMIFISSTYVDLKNYRKRAIETVNRCKCTPLAMEFFIARPQEPTKASEKEIDECDIFVGLYAHRYGFVPKGQEKSITRLEYERAKERNKDCLCFVVKEDFPWNPKLIEKKNQARLRDFLALIKTDKTVAFFKSPKDFEIKLATSLGNLLKEKMECGSFIPLAPSPYIAHPYALPEHFSGRRAEMAGLSNWFDNEKEPVLVLEAIGGMGKSALSWAWLQRHIIERAVKVDGVFWWSFYEKPFETFISRLACYVTGKREKENGLSIDLEEVSAVLHHRRFLLVLDGMERVLRGYAGMEAMYIQEKRYAGEKGAAVETEDEWDKRMREPVDPRAGRFLRGLAGGKTKTLITTRLNPACLEGIAGIKPVFLKGLTEDDTVSFFRSEGINGTRAEIVQAGQVYDFHPLMLKLLASSILRSRARDIKDAYSKNLIQQDKPYKILTTSFGLLSAEERRVAMRSAVFRGVFTVEAIAALAPGVTEDRLWDVLQELRNLGFLFEDEKPERFDIHPVLRSFLYGQLSSAEVTGVHDLAAQYFQAVSGPEKVVSLEDLAPVIELYYHLVKAGKYDEALDLFFARIDKPTYYQLSAYPLRIELLRELFPDGEDRLPRLKDEEDQAWTLNALANSHSLSGQPIQAVMLFFKCIKLPEKNAHKKNLAIGLENMAYPQIVMGEFFAAGAHVQKSISLCREIGDENNEAIGHAEWGRVLAFQGRITGNSRDSGAEFELDKASKYFEVEVTKNFEWLGKGQAYRSISRLVQARLVAARPGADALAAAAPGIILDAVEQARQALAYAEKTIKAKHPHPRDFIRAYGLLGEALIQLHIHSGQGGVTPGAVLRPGLEIPFYDQYFQQIVETLAVQSGQELHAAERCLQDALRRCRKANMIDFEPDILLGLVRLEWARVHGQPIPGKINRLPTLKEHLEEIHDLADRCGYRLILADLHLFCGQALMDCRSTGGQTHTLLGLTAPQHLQKTKKYALDVSEFADLYASSDPDFYKGIPEYEMLKRGPTPEERIQNGYFPAYQMAEALEANL